MWIAHFFVQMVYMYWYVNKRFFNMVSALELSELTLYILHVVSLFLYCGGGARLARMRKSQVSFHISPKISSALRLVLP
jgi:hypothetical protein